MKKFNVQNIWQPLSNRVRTLVVTRKRILKFLKSSLASGDDRIAHGCVLISRKLTFVVNVMTHILMMCSSFFVWCCVVIVIC